jgi:hypothetical protein
MEDHVKSEPWLFIKTYKSEIFLLIFILLISLSLPAPNPMPELFTGVLYILVFFLLRALKTDEIYFKKHIKNLIQIRDHSAYGIIGALGLLCVISWNVDLFMEGKSVFACMFAFNFVNLVYFYFIFMPDKLKNISDKLEKRKVFISAAPFNMYRTQIRTETDNLCDVISKLDVLKSNWSLPLKSIKFHGDTLELICFLNTSSDSGNTQYNLFKETLYKLKDKFGLGFEIIEKQGVDVNDVQSIKSKTRQIIQDIKENGYSDADISFNISTGTSLISNVFMIFCFIPLRQAEYYVQGNENQKHKPIKILPDTEDVKNL